MSTVRNIQIDLLLDNQNSIVEWFNDLWSELSVVETVVFKHKKKDNEQVYYNKNKEFVFYICENQNNFWCSSTNFWLIMETKFKLGYNDISSITNLLLGEKLNINIFNSGPSINMTDLNINEALYNKLKIN